MFKNKENNDKFILKNFIYIVFRLYFALLHN